MSGAAIGRPKRAVRFDGDYSLIEKKIAEAQLQNKKAVRRVITNELFCLLKHVKHRYTGKKNLYDQHCAVPREDFSTFVNQTWRDSNRLVDECRFNPSGSELKELNRQYEEFSNVFFDLATHPKGFRHRVDPAKPSPEPIAFITGLTKWVWRLFVGVDREDTSLNFRDVDALMEMFLAMSAEELDVLHAQRKTWKTEYIDNRPNKNVPHAWIVLDDTHWLVSTHFDLPWQIPTRYNWHNSKAVRPTDTVNISEAAQCGRLVGANANLYQFNLDYKIYLPRGIDLHHNIIGTRNPPANWWLDWFYNDFTWIQRPYKLAVVPMTHIGNHLIMIFTRSFIEKYLGSESESNSIVVPHHSYICSLSGELRPVDHTVTDGHSVEISEKRTKQFHRQLDIRPCNFICTSAPCSKKRPGVGNHGFMANSTCRDAYFELVKQQIGKNQSHVVRAASCIYKHCFLVAQKHLRVSDIFDKHSALMRVAKQNKDNEILDLGKQYYIFPVEFVYDEKQGRPDAVECACLTHCYTELPKGTVNIEIRAVEVRHPRESPYTLDDLHNDLSDITVVQRTNTGFPPYIDTVRWLKQFSTINTTQLTKNFLPKKRTSTKSRKAEESKSPRTEESKFSRTEESDDSFDEFSTWAVSSESDDEFYQRE